MELQQEYRDDELQRIIEEAALYMCACPGQVASEISQLRSLIRYQRDCEKAGQTPTEVHRTIAAAGRQAHTLMETCLTQVLALEGWDRQTLEMPEGLRKLRDDIIARDF